MEAVQALIFMDIPTSAVLPYRVHPFKGTQVTHVIHLHIKENKLFTRVKSKCDGLRQVFFFYNILIIWIPILRDKFLIFLTEAHNRDQKMCLLSLPDLPQEL